MPGVSSARAERLVNLVLCLLSTRQFLSAERIRATVPGYADAPTDEAFSGCSSGTRPSCASWACRWRPGATPRSTPSTATASPGGTTSSAEIDLEPDEAAAVALAARLWDSPQLAGAAHGALLKLRAAGVEVDEAGGRCGAAAGAGRRTGVRAAAGRRCRPGAPSRFAHRRGGPTGEVAAPRPSSRGASCPGAGRWYLVGHDRDRDRRRCSGSPASSGR